MGEAKHNLLSVIFVTEHVKSVVLCAHKINLLALNAMLLSKRSGQAAVGFGVISNELRSFSRDLASCMKVLDRIAFESLSIISILHKQQRLNYLLNLAAEQSPPNGRQALVNYQERFLGYELETTARLNRHRQTFASDLEEAGRLGDYGDVIARFAKIEAAYGNAFSGQLMEIAQEFNGLIRDVIPLIQNLRHHQ